MRIKIIRGWHASIPLGLGLSLLPSGTAAQGIRVSRPMLPGPGIPGNRVVSFQNVSQGEAVLFEDLSSGTYRVPVAGGAAQRVHGGRPTLVSNTGQRYVWEFSISVDGHTGWRDRNIVSAAEDGSGEPIVLWRATPLTAEESLLSISPDGQWAVWREMSPLHAGDVFSCRTDGSGTPQVLVPDASPSELRVDPSSARVLFRLASSLYSVPIDGALPPVLLDGSFSAGSYEVTPDGQRVVFKSSPTQLSVRKTDGSDPETALSAPLVAGGVIQDFRIAPDGSFVVYRASALVPGRDELFRVPIDGSAPPVTLVPGLGSAADVQLDYGIDDAGEFVVYRADASQDERFELFSVRADGSTSPIVVSSPLTTGGDVLDFRLAPVGQLLAYRADGEVPTRIDLHGSWLDGSSPAVRLSEVGQANADVQEDYQIPPGGTVVYFRHDRERDEDFQLLARLLSGVGPSRMLNGPLDPGRSVEPGFLCAFAGARVVYRSDEEVNGRVELWSASLIHPRVRLNHDLTVGTSLGDATGVQVAQAGSRVVYRADRERNEVHELHGASLDGAPNFVKLNDPLGSANDVLDFETTPDGAQVLFLSNQEQNLPHLFVAPADGSQPARRLSDLATGGELGIQDYFPARNGPIVLYRNISDQQLFSARLDVPAPSLLLTPVLPPGWSLSSRPLDESAGQSQVYFSTASASASILHAAAVDGSLPALQLASSPFPGGFVVRECPDALRIVFTGPLLSSRNEIFAQPADGSAPPLRLNSPMIAAGGNVDMAFGLTADSQRAVYRADAEVDGVFDLYSVPVDGSSAPFPLTRLTAPESVLDFRLTSDSQRLVFRSSPSAGSTAIFGVPIDGSSPPVRLNPPTDFVGLYWLEPDSSHVLFTTDLERPDLFNATEVWRSRIDGTTPAVRVGPTLEPWGSGFSRGELGPNGKQFAMTFQDGRSLAFELVLVDLATLATRKVMPSLPPNGRVAGFVFTPDSRRLLTVADQRESGVFEVFQSWIDRPVRRGP